MANQKKKMRGDWIGDFESRGEGTFFLDEVVELPVAAGDEEERVGEGVEEDFFEGLENADVNGGKELEAEPEVDVEIAGIGDVGGFCSVGAG